MRAVILSAVESGHPMEAGLQRLEAGLAKAGYEQVQRFETTQLRLAYCQGEFDCWLKTPGVCRTRDSQEAIVEAVHDADAVVLFGPLTFGGHGYHLKLVLDRFLCLLEPFFQQRLSLTHHSGRYAHHQRFYSVAWAAAPSEEQRETFARLNDANAINYLAPECAAVVLDEGRPERWAEEVRALFYEPHTPGEALGQRVALRAELLAAAAPDRRAPGPRSRAALLVGSPKVKGSSASEVILAALCKRLEAAGVLTEVHFATEFVHESANAHKSAAAIAACDLFVLVTPLYVDAFPSLTTHALELVAQARQGGPTAASFAVIVNCGFPEAEQNRTALRIARHFAQQANYVWGGGLPIGAGGAVQPDRPLDQPRGPTGHIVRALDLAGPALAQTGVLTADAIADAAEPSMPDSVYRTLGDLGWRWQAYQLGVPQKALHARPLDEEH